MKQTIPERLPFLTGTSRISHISVRLIYCKKYTIYYISSRLQNQDKTPFFVKFYTFCGIAALKGIEIIQCLHINPEVISELQKYKEK